MTPEEYFFRYAFPCTEELVKRKLVDDEAFKQISKAAHEVALGKNSTPSREKLERVYKNAFKRIMHVAEKLNKACWDMEVITQYFLEEHNSCIDSGEDLYANAPQPFRELCKVHEAEIAAFIKTVEMHYNSKKRPVEVYKVRYGGKEKLVFNFYNLKDLDGKVRIHYAFIIEKV